MAVTKKEVQRVAELSRLEFTEEELLSVQKDLNSVLEYMDVINRVDVSGTEGLVRSQGGMREDEPLLSVPTQLILKNAPKSEGNCFVVPKVLE